jgi:hypothetical protein
MKFVCLLLIGGTMVTICFSITADSYFPLPPVKTTNKAYCLWRVACDAAKPIGVSA